jgi:hypothetical protein
MKAVNGEAKLRPSKGKIDWLGMGIYFWEGDPQRAMEWARQKKARNELSEPFVIGAVIDLGNCLDLTVRENIELVRAAHTAFELVQKTANLPMPENTPAPKDQSPNKVLRYLDCAVINHLHTIVKSNTLPGITPFDTVRALFPEQGGEEIYRGSGFMEKTHTQIAVLTPSCIKGVFLPII